jgi:hypothetical protein
MAPLPTQSTITSPSDLPLVGIVPVRLPADSDPMRSVWLDQTTLIVGYDPARLTRHLVKLILDQNLGSYRDVDAEVTR